MAIAMEGPHADQVPTLAALERQREECAGILGRSTGVSNEQHLSKPFAVASAKVDLSEQRVTGDVHAPQQRQLKDLERPVLHTMRDALAWSRQGQGTEKGTGVRLVR